MRLTLEPEEARELLDVITERLLQESGLDDGDRAAMRRWRSESMKPGSEGMRELTAKINAELERTLAVKSRSAVVKPDWR